MSETVVAAPAAPQRTGSCSSRAGGASTTGTPVTGSIAETDAGRSRCKIVAENGKITAADVPRYPEGNGKAQQINAYTLLVLKPRRAAWRPAIEDPDPEPLVAVVPIRIGVSATSGAAHRDAHVVDARTGRPPLGLASDSPRSPSSARASLRSTSTRQSRTPVGPDAAARWLINRGHHAGLLVDTTGTTVDLRTRACHLVRDGPRTAPRMF